MLGYFLAGCVVAGCVAIARSDSRAEVIAKARRGKYKPFEIEAIDSSSPVPGRWAVPLYAEEGPWPVRAWWPSKAGVPYAYSDDHNMAA